MVAGMRQTKSAPLRERSCERFSAEPELLLLLTTDAADSTRGKRRAASDLRTPIQQDISLKNDGSASGRKAGNNADCESTVFYRCLLVVSGSAGDLPYSGFLRRWRRFISPCIAALINCPVLSPSAFTCSIPSMISCGMRAVTDWDFAFFEPVAMSNTSCDWCKTIYTKKYSLEVLTCKTPLIYLVSYTMLLHVVRTEARQCANTNRASNHNPNHPE